MGYSLSPLAKGILGRVGAVAKRGPKPGATKRVKEQILACVRRGLSLADALLVAGLSHTAYVRAKQEDEEFGRGVKSASARGKDFHLSRIEAGEKNWQASAWFLERKYGAEYGQKVQLEHGGSVTIRDLERGKTRAEEYRRSRLAEQTHESNGRANGTTH